MNKKYSKPLCLKNNIYADRDIIQLDVDGEYYCTHVAAMTKEGLHEKSDIAAELGHRDKLIDDLSKSKWISVEDRLPELHDEILVYSEDNGVELGSLQSYGFESSFTEPDDITHWQPLPADPK